MFGEGKDKLRLSPTCLQEEYLSAGVEGGTESMMHQDVRMSERKTVDDIE